MSRRRFMPTKGGRKDSRVIALTFAKPSGKTLLLQAVFHMIQTPRDLILLKCILVQHWMLIQLAAFERSTHTHTGQRVKWNKMMLLSKWQGWVHTAFYGVPAQSALTSLTGKNRRKSSFSGRDVETASWLTFLGECVAGRHAFSVGDHTGEDAKILLGETVENSSGPKNEKVNGLILGFKNKSTEGGVARTHTCCLRWW